MRLLATAPVLWLMLAVGCGSKPEPEPEPQTAAGAPAAAGSSRGAGSATGSASAQSPSLRPPGAGSAALPSECDDYRATVARLAQCGDAIPAEMREQLGAMLDREWATWANAPAQAAPDLAKLCRDAVTNVKAAASAACGW